MSRSSFLIFSFLFSAAFCGAEAASEESSHRVSIETISDLKLSGYHDDERGDLQWRLEAETAEADPQTKAEDIKRARWNLRRLRLLTFGKNGEKFAEMTSPEGRFSPEKREADSEARVEVKGADFTVRGRGWSWSGRGHDNLIRVHDSVFVSIAQPDKEENLNVLSKRLSIQGTDAQTVLTFSGGVSVSRGDIHMSSDTLEIIVPEGGARGLESGIGGRGPAGGGELNSVRSITGRGGVRISRGQTQIEGDAAEFLPRENLFFVRGNASLNDFTGQLTVRGDEAVGKIDEQLVEITATKPNAALPLAPVAVSVEMPSFAMRGNAPSSGGGNAETRTVVTGKRMTVRSSESKNEVSLFGEVHVEDRDIRIDADKLVVTADASGDVPLFQSESAEGERSGGDDLRKVRAVEAEGGVRADYGGRVLHCDRAEVFPQDGFILLTGTPRVVSLEENAALSGDRVEVFLDRDQIEVFSEKGEDAARRRVTVELPGISAADAARRAGTPGGNAGASVTEIVGDHLTLTRGDGLSTFDIFGNVFLKSDALRGSCDRIVVFADPKSPRGGVGASRAKTDISQLRKIIALGNVALAQDGYELTGGKATITPAVGLKEWVTDSGDEEFSDGKTPIFVVVEPDPADGPRPRITFPEDAAGAKLEFALPTNSVGEKNEPSAAAGVPADEPGAGVPAKKSSLESDSMELIAGDSRARFFLRGNVVFETTGGARGICESVEGLLAPPSPDADSGGFEAKKVICRGNVRLTHDGSTGRGSTLEIFPPENKAVLSGNAHFRDKDGVELFPGNDRFVFDLARRQMITTSAAGADDALPAQVARPQIIIPKGSNRVFVVPKSVRGNGSRADEGENGGGK